MKKEYLLSPGPTPVPPEALLAMAEPMFHHRTPRFCEMFKEVTEGLKKVFCTKGDVITLFGSGTAAMESAVVNVCDPGEKAIVVQGGKFGERWAEICEAYGVSVIAIDVEWGTAVKPEQIAAVLRQNPGVVAVYTTLVETSTGVLNDVKAIGEILKNTNALHIVDGISGVGAVECRTDDWGIDMLVVGSQKALMVPPGLAYISVSAKAWKKVDATKRGRYYFDLRKHKKATEKLDPAFTPPVSLFAAQRESLKLILDEGIENVWKRVSKLAGAQKAAIRAMGLQEFSRAPADCLVTVAMPDGVDGEKVVKHMRDVQGVTPAGGQDKLKGKVVRLASMGYINDFDILTGIVALANALAVQNYNVDVGAGIDAFVKEMRK
jgi:aspartate aminotransferase-like enzyme